MTPPGIRIGSQPRLAEHQLRRWDLQHRPGEHDVAATCVAISRLPGAGGAEVGRLVAERLDYGLFGREIVEECARELHVDMWLLSGLDERMRGTIDRFVEDLFGKGRLTEDDYLRRVTRIIATLGQRGSAVLVGRGAAFILPSERTLRVLLVAPRAQRVERFAKVKGLALERAGEAVAQAERQRAEFVQRQFGVRHDDPSLYDLVLNTGTLGFEDAAEIIVGAVRRRFSG